MIHGFLRCRCRNHSKSAGAAALSPPRFVCRDPGWNLTGDICSKPLSVVRPRLRSAHPRSRKLPRNRSRNGSRASARALWRKASPTRPTRRVMGNLKPDTTVFTEIRSQPEFNQQLWQYLNRRVSDWRIQTGQERAKTYASLFARIEKDYGVQPSVMLGLWGIEFDLRRPGREAEPLAPDLPGACGAGLGRAAAARLLGNRAHQRAAHRGKGLGHAKGDGRLMGRRNGPHPVDAGGLAQRRHRLRWRWQGQPARQAGRRARQQREVSRQSRKVSARRALGLRGARGRPRLGRDVAQL